MPCVKSCWLRSKKWLAGVGLLIAFFRVQCIPIIIHRGTCFLSRLSIQRGLAFGLLLTLLLGFVYEATRFIIETVKVWWQILCVSLSVDDDIITIHIR